MRFRVYYGDGSTYSEKDGSPFNAPAVDVQVIAIETDSQTGFGLMHGKGFYTWDKDLGWNNADEFGLYDYLMQPGPRKVVFGRTRRTDDFWRIVGRAGKEGLG